MTNTYSRKSESKPLPIKDAIKEFEEAQKRELERIERNLALRGW